jgi:NAD-dependent dihydropyrimidine dehydrogenase PreA subunit
VRSGFNPEIDPEACKGCLICVYICSERGAKILKESEKKTSMGGLIPDIESGCIGCRWCERYCPDFAISVEEIKSC